MILEINQSTVFCRNFCRSKERKVIPATPAMVCMNMYAVFLREFSLEFASYLELVVLPPDEAPPYGLDLVQDALHLVVAELLQHADRARAEEHLECGKLQN